MLTVVSPSRVEQLLPFLACPRCHSALDFRGEALTCPACPTDYRLQDGRPVFLPDSSPVRIMPTSHLSNQPPPDILDWLTWLDGQALNLGAGGTEVKLENCIELEYSLFRHTDVVADAHQLPFGD